MAKAVLAREEVEKLSLQKRTAFLAISFAPFAGFVEYLFMRNGPRDGRNRNRNDEQPEQLC
jgi:hypothetical protein